MVQIKNKGIYWALIVTFIALYVAVAFVSTLHAITFFQLANTLSLAILLGAAYEIGQATVLFSILMTHNNKKPLAWGMMFLLTALQVTANVYASFKFMDGSANQDWTYWQRSILFAVQGQTPEMYKIIISWISGALLPLVALGMTALVAENIRIAQGGYVDEDEDENEEKETTSKKEEISKGNNLESITPNKPNFNFEKDYKFSHSYDKPAKIDTLDERPIVGQDDINVDSEIDIPINHEKLEKKIEKPKQEKPKQEKPKQEKPKQEKPKQEKPKQEKPKQEKPKQEKTKNKIEPVNKFRGWHFKNEFVDDEHNVFHKGKFIKNDPDKIPTSKKA